MKRYLEVCRYGTNEVVKRLDVSTRTDAEVARIEAGLLRNMNTADYYVAEATDPRVPPRPVG